MDAELGKKFQGMNIIRNGASYPQEVRHVRGFDKEFQKEVEEFRHSEEGTINQTTSRDRNDVMENQETRRDSNNR
jgi:hypothetical protein